MPAEKMTMSFEEFLKQLIKKWKLIGVITILCAGLFAGSGIMLGEEIVVPHSEEYLHYEQELQWHEDYLENSTLMALDPTCIYERTIFIRNISDEELLKNYVRSSEVWEDFQTDRDKKYFYELTSWNKKDDTGTVEFVLHHATSEECKETAEYLENKIKVFDPSAEVTIGAEKVVADEALQEEHLRWYSRIDYVNSLLLDAEAGYTITVNLPAAVITGALAGGMLSVVIVFMMCVFGKNKKEES